VLQLIICTCAAGAGGHAEGAAVTLCFCAGGGSSRQVCVSLQHLQRHLQCQLTSAM